MSDTTEGMAAYSKDGELAPWTFPLRAMDDDDVEIQVTHCGVCYSDIHTIEGSWARSASYPMVVGHEIIGHISKLGAMVKGLKLGQRVGVGPQGGSCVDSFCGKAGKKACPSCAKGRENCCYSGMVGTYAGKLPDGSVTQGGYALKHRTKGKFAIPIPDDLPSEVAAPLLCAGITVYAPLKYANITKGSMVGVIGIGGLGHIAIKLANAMGATVVALSTTPDKQEAATKLGAKGFIHTGDAKAMAKAKRSLDFILSTVSANINVESYLRLLKPGVGHFATVSAPPAPGNITISAFTLLQGLKVSGTGIGSPAEIKEMLEFCSKHQIACDTEVFPIAQANQALDKVKKNKIRFRAVLEMPTESSSSIASKL